MHPKPRVRVVDDEPGTRALLRATLSADFEVDEADTSTDVLRVVAVRHYDLVVLDVVLATGQSGYSICHAIRALPGGDALKIALCTGMTGVIGRRLGREAGADAYIAKPFSPATLLAALHSLLAGRLRR